MNTIDGAEEISRLDRLRGMRLWNLSGGLSAVYIAITTGAYSTGYALHLGASEALIGLLSAAPSWGQLLQVLSPLFIERLKSRKRFCLVTYSLGYSAWLPIALIPFLFEGNFRPWAMVLFVTLSGATLAIGSPASTSWLTDLVPESVRGRFFGRQQSILAAVGLATSLSAGWYLDIFDEQTKQTGFIVLFTVAVVFALLSVMVWSAVPEPRKAEGGESSPLKLILLPLRDRNFMNLTVFICARTLAVMTAGPFFTVYMLKELEVPYAQIAVLAGMSTIASVLSNPLWGYLADKYGHKPILRISALGIALTPLWWCFATKGNYWFVVSCAQIWSGLLAPGAVVSQFNLMVKTAPENSRSAYVGFHSAAVNLAASVGAMLGGLLADGFSRMEIVELLGHPITHLQWLFLTSFALRMITWPLLVRVPEEKAVPARVVLERLRSRQPVTTLWNLMRMLRSSDPATKAQAARALGNAGSALAVEELIALIDDSDRQVRREAARALGQIGDTRAVAPLIAKLRDPAADMVEEAAEALSLLPTTSSSIDSLSEMLQDERPWARKSAAIALGEMGDPRAQEPLERLLEHESDPTVYVAAAEALSKIGGRSALHILRRLLRRSDPGVGRKKLAAAIGALLGPRGAFYKLLEADATTQEVMVAQALSMARRQLLKIHGIDPEQQAQIEDNSSAALQYFTRERYSEMVACLHRLASGSLRAFTTSDRCDLLLEAEGHEDSRQLSSGQKIGRLVEANDHLRLNLGFLSGLTRDSRRHRLHREEALLGLFAFRQVIGELVEMERRCARIARGSEGG